MVVCVGGGRRGTILTPPFPPPHTHYHHSRTLALAASNTPRPLPSPPHTLQCTSRQALLYALTTDHAHRALCPLHSAQCPTRRLCQRPRFCSSAQHTVCKKGCFRLLLRRASGGESDMPWHQFSMKQEGGRDSC